MRTKLVIGVSSFDQNFTFTLEKTSLRNLAEIWTLNFQQCSLPFYTKCSDLFFDWAVQKPELETSICDAKYFIGMEHSDVLSMEMDIDLMFYRTTLVRTFQVALSVIPGGSWGDVARRFTMIRLINRSDLIVDRDYDEATTMDLKPMFTGPWPDPSPLWFKPGTSSDEDSCPLARLKNRGAKRMQVVESSDSEATASVSPVLIMRKQWTKRAKKVPPTINDQAETQPNPISDIPAGVTGPLPLVDPKHIRRLVQHWRHELVMSPLLMAQRGMWRQIQNKKDGLVVLIPTLMSKKSVWSMPPRRGIGRTTRRTAEESRAGSDDDVHQVANVTRQIGEMELVLARFQRTNPPTFSAAEGGAMAEAWLVQMEELFNTLEYAPEKRLNLALLQLRDNAQCWWRGTSRILCDSGAVITWESLALSVIPGGSWGDVARRFTMIRLIIMPEWSNAIIGVVIDGVVVSEYHRAVMVVGPEYHGPMISTGCLAVRGIEADLR
ncbi:hypothetical protein F511_30654 [Dorcoceras hygrometricum]|uniref:Uncharacterized protein n=1 Tax=Dorcoceras hygrometricum TaxID=472368 RepID=A0A2Z7AMN2_9LAMI|nr:hypothetical protein F511_30654 [Dorcoceras hygrometricum]